MKIYIKKVAACLVSSFFVGLCFAQTGSATAEAAAAQVDDVKQDDAQEAAAQPDSTDPYTGWSYSTAKKVEYTQGHVSLKLRGDQGTFGLYAVSDSGKETPLFSSYDFFNSTYFMLRVGRKEYAMHYSGGVKSEARQTSYGAQMAYEIPGKAVFIVDFTFPQETADMPEMVKDCVRVNLYTVNLSENPQTFTVKGIFDTILGESTSSHFSTAAVPEMNKQKQFHSMKNDKWIRSSNKKAAVQFMLSGADISEPECVTLGPVDSLARYWQPEVHESKGYSTVLSYNNSGVAVNWKTAYLLSSQVDVKTFYITVAEGVEPIYAGKTPAGDDLISSLESGNELFPGSSIPDLSVSDAQPAGTETASKDNGAGSGKTVELSPAAQAVTEEQLDPEYIQNLIDYIDSLSSADDIDKEELKSLNDELDAIFEKLRSIGN